jgi:hypothetical protein
VMVSQFVRDTSAAETVSVEAAIHRDAVKATDMGAHEAANVSTAKAANMSNAEAATEAADMAAAEAAAKTATTTRESDTTSRGQSNHRGCCDCDDLSLHQSFHDTSPFLIFSGILIRGSPARLVPRVSSARCIHWRD